MDRLSDYDYELPPELLATEPPENVVRMLG